MILSLIKPVRDGHSYHIWEALFGFSNVDSETYMLLRQKLGNEIMLIILRNLVQNFYFKGDVVGDEGSVLKTL